MINASLYPYEKDTNEKMAEFLPTMRELCVHHTTHCPDYAAISAAFFCNPENASIEELPFIPARLFKTRRLQSITDTDILRTLTSSGTNGLPSRIYLDAGTARAQTRALADILGHFLGPQRLPMLIIDSETTVKKGNSFSARSAGILGFSVFGRAHCYALDEDLRPNWERIRAFTEKHAGQPVFVFGFTFLVWQSLLLKSEQLDIRFAPGSLLLHGGGWKKLVDQQVSAQEFKTKVGKALGITRVHSYYGMVEQVGSIFMECEHGHLHAPAHAHVCVRDPQTLQILSIGSRGLIQVLSLLPHSYPGHSILTEDVGVWLGDDDCPCGRQGRYFHVEGRLPRTEARGCSDTMKVPA